MASTANLARHPFPRILPSTSEYLNTAPVRGQKTVAEAVGGDDTKRYPGGKPILSARAQLLHRRGQQERDVRERMPSYQPRPLPAKFHASARTGTSGSKRKRAMDARPQTSDRFSGR